MFNETIDESDLDELFSPNERSKTETEENNVIINTLINNTFFLIL